MKIWIKRYLPNFLTIFRLFLSPVVFWLFYSLISESFKDPLFNLLVLLVFCLFCLTDYLDGWFARKWRAISSFGSTFDPIADKVLILGLIICLMIYGHLYLWIGIPLILRDVIMDFGRLFLYLFGLQKNISAIFLAKVKTTFQMIGIFFAIIFIQVLESDSYSRLLNLIFGFATIFSIWSFIIYIKKYAT